MSQASPDTSANDLPEPRELTDPKVMRALTHPVRLALLEVLATEGPLTATEAGELIGESPTTCSFHFRQLKKYGFIEEAGTVLGASATGSSPTAVCALATPATIPKPTSRPRVSLDW